MEPRYTIRNPQFTCPLRCNAMIRANSKYDHIGKYPETWMGESIIGEVVSYEDCAAKVSHCIRV